MTLAQQALSESQLMSIAQARALRRERTMVLTLDREHRVVLKAQRPTRQALGYQLLNLFAWMTGQACLRAAPVRGGAQAQSLELARLRALAAAGVPVPRLLYEGADYFVMSHAEGPDLASHLPRDPSQLRERWNLGLNFLRKVHACGQYLSQAFARNMIVTSAGIVAIDFEDDPLQVMPLQAAQARDWLAYLHSTLWMLPRCEPWVLADLHEALRHEAQGVREILRELAQGWSWLRHLPSARRPWGRDLISLQALAEVMFLNQGKTAAHG